MTDDTIDNQNSAEGMVDDPGQQIAEEISQPDLAGGVANAHPAEFPSAAPARGRARIPLERFADVNIEITAEIGRVTMPLGELLQLSEGAVIELDRSVTEPVDILAQGVRIARGDVVVIDDRFAIQIREIVNSDEQSSATEEILTA